MKKSTKNFLFKSILFIFQSTIAVTLTVPIAQAAYTDNGNGTMTDTTTGLTWMRCSVGQTWSARGCDGTASSHTLPAARIMTTNFAGQSDWRLPTIRELHSIVDRSVYSPAIDKTAFPNTPGLYYWSASAYAGGASYGWCIDFYSGYATAYCGQSDLGNVRLVRGSPSSDQLNLARPTSDYVDHGNGTVTHTPSGLTWKRCMQGQIWTGSGCDGTPSETSWDAAMAMTDSFAGHSDWRLPTAKEIETLVDYTSYDPALNRAVLPTSAFATLWSATVDYHTDYAWHMDAYEGSLADFNQKNTPSQVRLVRSAGTGGNTTKLVAGWNLLGNGINATFNVASTFGDPTKVITVWKWIAPQGKWAFYTPTQADAGADYASSKGYDRLTSVAAGEGYWVNATTAFTATLPVGTAIGSAAFKNMAADWNLIAVGDNKTPVEFNKALSTTPPAAGEIPSNFTSLWTWDAALEEWYFYAPSLDSTGELASYVHAKGYLDFATANKKLGPEVGFWVNKESSTGPTPIGPAGGTVETVNAKIVVPSGAVSHPVSISITPGQPDTPYTPLSDTFNMTFRDNTGTAFDITNFSKDVQIEVSLKSTIPSGSSSKYFLMVSSPDGYSLLPATVSGNTVRATLPSISTTSSLAQQNAGPRLTKSRATASSANLDTNYGATVVQVASTESEHFIYYFHEHDDINLINKTKANLEEAYKKLEDYGFSWSRFGSCRFDKNTFSFIKMPVYFRYISDNPDELTYGQYGGRLIYSPCTYYWSKYIEMNTNPSALTDPVKAKGFTAHELFHFLQAIYTNSATSFLWLDEASSVWLQNTIADPNEAQCFTDTWEGFSFTARGLFNPFNSLTSFPKNIAAQHGYAAAAFFLYADDKGYFNIKELWDALRNSKGEVSSLKSSMSKDLAMVWSEYAEAFYSGKNLNHIKGGKCIWDLSKVFVDERTVKNKIESVPFAAKANIDLYDFSATPFILQYASPSTVTTDIAVEIKNLTAGQKAAVYLYDRKVNADPQKLGEITSSNSKFTSSPVELSNSKYISVVLIDTNMPASGSASAHTPRRVEVSVYGGPNISELLPNIGTNGVPVTIIGTGFGATQGSGKLTFGSVNAAVTSWSANRIESTVPTGIAGAVNVTVTANGISSKAKTFTVNPISSHSVAFSSVQVTGSGWVASNVSPSGARLSREGSSSTLGRYTQTLDLTWNAPSGTLSRSGLFSRFTVTVVARQITHNSVHGDKPIKPQTDGIALYLGPAVGGLVTTEDYPYLITHDPALTTFPRMQWTYDSASMTSRGELTLALHGDYGKYSDDVPSLRGAQLEIECGEFRLFWKTADWL